MNLRQRVKTGRIKCPFCGNPMIGQYRSLSYEINREHSLVSTYCKKCGVGAHWGKIPLNVTMGKYIKKYHKDLNRIRFKVWGKFAYYLNGKEFPEDLKKSIFESNGGRLDVLNSLSGDC